MIMGGSGVVGRRLSKPRTNNSSTNLVSWSDVPAEIPSSPLTSSEIDYYFGEQATTVSSQGERRSRRKSRSKLRAYLYGSSPHESSQSSDDEEDQRRNSLVDAARGAKKRLSRTGSSIMQLSSAKASTNYLSSTSTTNLPSSDPEESIRVAEEIKERARLDKIAAQNHISSPVDEDKHVDSVMAPLRRKSLYTPGIATRESSDILRKPPPPQNIVSQADRDYYYNPAYPATSPLAQLAALGQSENGRETPTQDVTHLGGLQLGTLRVMNGMDSPTSLDSISIHRRRAPSPTSTAQEDFQTASEGSDNEEQAQQKQLQRDLTIKASPNTVNPYQPTSPARTNLKKHQREPYPMRTSFPFSRAPSDPASALAKEYTSELGGSPFSLIETPQSSGSAQSSSGFIDEGLALSSSRESAVHVPGMDSLKTMMDEVELAGASGSTREDAFSKLNGSSTASKQTAYAHPTPGSDSGYSSKSSLSPGQNEVSNRNSSQGTRSHRSSLGPRLVSGARKISDIGSKKESQGPPTEPPPQVRPSFTVIPRHALADPELEQTAMSTGALETINAVRASARAQSQVLVKKLQKARPKSLPPPPVSAITVQRYRDIEQIHIPRVPSVIAARHAERLVRFPHLDHTFPSTEHVTVSRTSTLTQAFNVPIRFPSPAVTFEPSAAVSHTSLQLLPEGAASSPLKTANDEWGSSSLVKSPSWSAFEWGKQKKLEKKAVKERKEAEKKLTKEEKDHEKQLAKNRKDLEKQLRKDESKEKSNRSRRSSWSRAKSSERHSSEHNSQAAITDFGTVTESLGASPYDVARLTPSTNDLPRPKNQPPHQIGTATPRARLDTRVDIKRQPEPSPARGRARSQSIERPVTPATNSGLDGSRVHARPQTMYAEVPPVPALSAVDLRHHDLHWARHHQRNRSASKVRADCQKPPSIDSCGGGPVRRPQSMVVQVPPVAAPPFSNQAHDQREFTQPRRQSMALGPRVDKSVSPKRPKEVSRDGVKISPRKPKTSSTVPDVWTSGSLERRGPVDAKASNQSDEMATSAIAPNDPSNIPSDNVWEAQRQAWRERRKSAGEALSLQNQIKDIFSLKSDSLATSASIPDQQISHPQSPISKSSSTTDFSGLDHVKKIRRPGLSPLVPSTAATVGTPGAKEPTVITTVTTAAASSSTTTTSITTSTQQRPTRESRGTRIPSLPTPAERRAQSRPQSIPRKRIGSGPSTPRSTSQIRATASSSNLFIPTTAEKEAPPPLPQSTAAVNLAPAITSTAPSTARPSDPPLQRLTGRYDGGLLYGYESGQGLGGSAGTRSSKTLASRKSVEISKGYGIDLSDVPVFVMPAVK